MNPSDFWEMQFKDWLNVAILVVTGLAVWFGPIRAVVVARREEEKALRLKQKSDIFASLMKTRRFQLDPEHVSSLNLIQVYFHDAPAVIQAYKAYIRLLSRRFTEANYDPAIGKERDDAFIELMFEIGRSVGLRQDRKELEELAYSPEGWLNDQETIKKLHRLMIELFENRRALSITSVIQGEAYSPFPPAPKKTDTA